MVALLFATSSASGQDAFGQMRENQAPFGTVRALPVHYGDLNLGRDEGASALLERLTIAARRVCSPDDMPELYMQVLYERCLHVAMDHAVADVGSPRVASLYTGQPMAVAENTYQLAIANGSRHGSHKLARHLQTRHYTNGARHRRA
jgi:UrcA family protein